MGFSTQGYHFLLQRIFLTQGSNLGLPHCRQTLYRLSHPGSINITLLRINLKETESRSVESDSLWPNGLSNSPWNSPGQNTGVGSLSVLQGIFPTQESNPGLLHCRWILYQLSHKGSPTYWILNILCDRYFHFRRKETEAQNCSANSSNLHTNTWADFVCTTFKTYLIQFWMYYGKTVLLWY